MQVSIDLGNIWEALTAVGTVGVAVIALWGDRFNLPRLKVVAKDLIGEIRFVNPYLGASTSIPPQGIYFCLHVENSRHWRPAKNCRVLLRGVHRQVPNGQYYREPVIAPLTFKWTNAVTDTQTIKSDAVLDFLLLVQGHEKFEPVLYPVNHPISSNVKLSLGAETVRYALEITADNFGPRMQVFEVTWNGALSNDVTTLRQHQNVKQNLKIREVTNDELKQTNYVDPNINPSLFDPK